MSDIYEILRECTAVYRHDPPVHTEDHGAVQVTHVWFNTLSERDAPDGTTHALIDCHFLTVAVDLAKAEEHRADFAAALESWPPVRDYAAENRLTKGPSYIEVGAQIGDQTLAFQFMALGEVLGHWRVLTPELLLPGIDDAEAARLAGGGMVLIDPSGKREPAAAPDTEAVSQ